MMVPPHVVVGACTHTGCLRLANEDDFLLGSNLAVVGRPLLFAGLADGMGGVAGGAEASRTAVRAVASRVLDHGQAGPASALLAAGFVAAEQRVFETASTVPALRDMGTTLTACCFEPGLVSFAHVGDTRLYRCRGGEVEQLTTDHAMRQPDNLLTKCIGGGQASCDFDRGSLPTSPGERFVLVSDGVWSVLPPAGFARLCERLAPQAAAEALVAAALAAGGPDNATALVIDVVAAADDAEVEAVELPREERPDDRGGWPPVVSLRPPAWPWLLLAASLAVLVHEVWLRLGPG